MRHGKIHNRFYLELPREIFTDEYRVFSTDAKWFYIVLDDLKHKLSDGKTDGSSFQSDKDLSEASGIKLTALKMLKWTVFQIPLEPPNFTERTEDVFQSIIIKN